MRKAHICFLDMKKNEFFRSDFRYEKVWVYNEEISNLILDINNKKIKKKDESFMRKLQTCFLGYEKE